MLKMLRRIVQEVNSAQCFREAMQTMVHHIRKAIETQACTVFLIDEARKEYVLMATAGLNPGAIGNVRFELSQGLVGFVGHREEPINLEDAPSHPNYLQRTEVGEERFKAFLGVPIIHHRRLLGVLMVQHEEKRRFDEAEEAFLVTLSAQLAGAIAHAEATGAVKAMFEALEDPTQKEKHKITMFEGVPSSAGIAIGHAVLVYPPAYLDAVPDRPAEDIPAEIQYFEAALAAAREEIHTLSTRLAPRIAAAERVLFDAYLQVLDSNGLGEEVLAEIRAGQWAQGALRKVTKRHIRQFEMIEDEYLRERAADIRDLGRRILSHLQAGQQQKPKYLAQTILVGEEITAAALAEVPKKQLVGIVSARGSNNSHVAILARALGVPAVMGVDSISISYLEKRELILDGYNGQIYVSPSAELCNEFQRLAEKERKLDAKLEALQELPAETLDGHTVSLFVNTGLLAEAGLSLGVGAEGVGLYRTEVPFMIRDRFPGEEEQRIIYRQLLSAFAPRPVIMRSLDIGGDKMLPYFPVEEDNPFLGWRGIRITLDHPEVFLVQARAMLKASIGFDNLRIMLPMITSVSEVDEALQLLKQAYQEVVEEGAKIVMPPIGIMIEVPSAVYQARALASRVDFLSVGSNDLTQYLLAVDRNNSRVANLYDCLHPSVLRALLQVVEGAHAEKKEVSLCGEMAADPISVILLLAMGFDALSVSSSVLLRTKWVIRSFHLTHAKKLLEEILLMENSQQIRSHLKCAIKKAGLGDLIRAGKK